jgi:hypothetical protein
MFVKVALICLLSLGTGSLWPMDISEQTIKFIEKIDANDIKLYELCNQKTEISHLEVTGYDQDQEIGSASWPTACEIGFNIAINPSGTLPQERSNNFKTLFQYLVNHPSLRNAPEFVINVNEKDFDLVSGLNVNNLCITRYYGASPNAKAFLGIENDNKKVTFVIPNSEEQRFKYNNSVTALPQ